MEKRKKFILIIVALFLLIFFGYFFMPKTSGGCGSALPLTCQICKCNRGFPYHPTPIGGNNVVKCFMGDLVECSAVD